MIKVLFFFLCIQLTYFSDPRVSGCACMCVCVEVEGGLIEHWSGTADIIWEEVLMVRLSPLARRTKRHWLLPTFSHTVHESVRKTFAQPTNFLLATRFHTARFQRRSLFSRLPRFPLPSSSPLLAGCAIRLGGTAELLCSASLALCLRPLGNRMEGSFLSAEVPLSGAY